MLKWAATLLLIPVLLGLPIAACGDALRVAVAANFAVPLESLSAEFAAQTGQHIEPIVGSTGTLFAQIVAGAPIHVFLAADQDRPARLVAAGLGSAQRTYAIGRLALWSVTVNGIDPTALGSKTVRRIALANPDLAPFGRAAREALERIPAASQAGKLVYGQNVAQVHALVATGAVDAGFVAWSAVRGEREPWLVPDSWHAPILQDAVLVRAGRSSAASQAFLDFLSSASARTLIATAGYEAPITGELPPPSR